MVVWSLRWLWCLGNETHTNRQAQLFWAYAPVAVRGLLPQQHYIPVLPHATLHTSAVVPVAWWGLVGDRVCCQGQPLISIRMHYVVYVSCKHVSHHAAMASALAAARTSQACALLYSVVAAVIAV